MAIEINLRRAIGLAPVGSVVLPVGAPVAPTPPTPRGAQASAALGFQRPKFGRIVAAIELSRQPVK